MDADVLLAGVCVVALRTQSSAALHRAASDVYDVVVPPTDAVQSTDRAPRGVTESQKVGAPPQRDIKRVRLI